MGYNNAMDDGGSRSANGGEELAALRHELAILRETGERFEALVQNIPVGLYRRTCGPDGKVLMANPAFLEMFGYCSVAELDEMPFARLYWNPAECTTFSNEVLSHGEVVKEEIRMRREDGAPLWVAITATLLCDEGGEPVFFDGIMEDITQRKQAEEKAALRQQQLTQADKMISLGILVSGVAHEINNPNQFIVSHVSALRRAWEDALPILDRYYEDHGDFLLAGRDYSIRRPQIQEMFAGILDGSRRIKRIVDELRDYSREHPADLTETLCINDVTKSALSLLSNLIKKSTKCFSVVYGVDIPPITGDYQRLEQVLINLVQNSCQALTDPGEKITVTTFYRAEERVVVVDVQDAGAGISPEDLKRIADPFFTTKRSSGGTGLGLSVSAAIVKKHGGTLEFISTVSEGTCARMSLPVDRPD